MAQMGNANAQGCGWLVAIALGLVLLSKCGGPGTPAAPDPSAKAATAFSTSAYVTARSLRCRHAPNATARVEATLRRDAQVAVVTRDGTWSQISRLSGDCWVASAFLADAPPARAIGKVTSAGGLRSSDRARSAGTTMGLAAIGAATTAGTNITARHGYRHRSPRRETTSTHRHARSHHPSRRSYGYDYSGGACPCAGRNICIGPRGGRYCITSGGNKRYGV